MKVRLSSVVLKLNFYIIWISGGLGHLKPITIKMTHRHFGKQYLSHVESNLHVG